MQAWGFKEKREFMAWCRQQNVGDLLTLLNGAVAAHGNASQQRAPEAAQLSWIACAIASAVTHADDIAVSEETSSLQRSLDPSDRYIMWRFLQEVPQKIQLHGEKGKNFCAVCAKILENWYS